jgi:hypothetical protein
MTTKKVFGIVLLGLSVGALVYLYKGYLKPRLEVDAEFNSGKSSTTTKTTN